MSEELGAPVEKTIFSFKIGDDAFIFIDFNSPDDEAIEQCLKDTEGARYTFIVSHGPVFPVGGVDDALALGVELCLCGIVGILSFVECSTYLFIFFEEESYAIYHLVGEFVDFFVILSLGKLWLGFLQS